MVVVVSIEEYRRLRGDAWGDSQGDRERLRGRDPDQAGVFAAWLEQLRDHFADRILSIDDPVADE